MNRFIIAIAAVSTLVAAPAFASDPARKADAKDNQSARVCVVQPARTGTIMPRKMCMTRGEWIAQTGADPSKK